MSKKRLQDWIRYVHRDAGAAEKSAAVAGPEAATESVAAEAGTVEPVAESAAPKPRQTRCRQRPETRAELLDRLVNPQISLHEASVLLKVCPATVRQYTRSGRLPHIRTPGGQRRFRFRDVMVLARELDSKK